ncbi:uncharacterized protein LOC122611825 [Drosophila teissieri]|uniref:uncharacterized protein LOC122611825 n=1 Tax=Drosophila teissieri TaxID=7243 RepID=UPI001CB9F5D6|nr:uncharacterized protein LOC122611825 [Drosophila teissieri]
MAKKTCRRLSQRDQELLCEFVRKSSTCAACQEPEYVLRGGSAASGLQSGQVSGGDGDGDGLMSSTSGCGRVVFPGGAAN